MGVDGIAGRSATLTQSSVQTRPRIWERPVTWLLAAILLALAVRLPMLGYGLPHIYYGDERYLVLPALRIAQTGDLNPQRLDYGSLFIYLLAGIDWGAAHVGILPPLQDIPLVPYAATYYPLPAVFLVGRYLSLAFSLLAVLGVFVLARLIFDKRVAVLAAALLAVSPLTVNMARYAAVDALLQALTIFALWAIMRVYASATWPRALLAGALVGLAASAKYTGVLLILPLTAAILLSRHRPAGFLPLVGAGVAAAGSFLLTSPFTVLDYAKFQVFVGVAQSDHLARAVTYVEGPSWRWYLGTVLSQGDRLFLALGVPGAILFTLRRPREGAVLMLFPIALFAVMCSGGVRSPRYLLPILAVLAVFSAWLLTLLMARLPYRRRWAGALAAAVCLTMLLSSTLLDIRTLSQPDGREVAAQWVRDNAGNTPLIADDMALADDPSLPKINRVTSVIDHSAAWYAERGYLVLGSDFRRLDPNRTTDEEARLSAFDADPALEMVAHLPGQMWGVPGYGVRIFRPRSP